MEMLGRDAIKQYNSIILKLIKSCSFPSCVGCQSPPPSSQAGAGLAAVHSPDDITRLHHTPPPLATLQPLHHDTVNPLRKWQDDKVARPLKGRTHKLHSSKICLLRAKLMR